MLDAVELFEKNVDIFDKSVIRENALRFSKERFEREIKRVYANKI